MSYLNASVSVASGRTYAGGLVKFEPREIERLHIPRQLLPAIESVPALRIAVGASRAVRGEVAVN